MSDYSAGKGWWHTLPGILTASAGLITAVTGLVVVLNQAGLLGKPGAVQDMGPQAFVDSAQAIQPAPNPVVDTTPAQPEPERKPEPEPVAPRGVRAVIQDPDGYVNVRSRPDTRSSVVTRIEDAELFTVEVSDESWWRVTTRDGDRGYVHRSRIRVLR